MKFAVLGALFLVGIAVVYADVNGLLALPYAVLFSLMYAAITAAVLRQYGIPSSTQATRFGVVPGTVADVLRALIGFAGMMLVAFTVPSYVPDTALGAAIIFVPMAALFALTMYYVAKALHIFRR
jgi:hypothetical protein